MPSFVITSSAHTVGKTIDAIPCGPGPTGHPDRRSTYLRMAAEIALLPLQPRHQDRHHAVLYLQASTTAGISA
jgi:hypothetical protein